MLVLASQTAAAASITIWKIEPSGCKCMELNINCLRGNPNARQRLDEETKEISRPWLKDSPYLQAKTSSRHLTEETALGLLVRHETAMARSQALHVIRLCSTKPSS